MGGGEISQFQFRAKVETGDEKKKAEILTRSFRNPCKTEFLHFVMLRISTKLIFPDTFHFILAKFHRNMAKQNKLIVSPTAVIVYLENIGFVYPAMSMMVIGPSLLY
jgi:hypothetical protein